MNKSSLKSGFFIISFFLLGLLPYMMLSQNYIGSNNEMTIRSTIDFSTSISWSTDRSATPGFFTWLAASDNYLGATDEFHVNGYVKKIGNTAFTFPVGSGTKLRALSISAPNSVSDVYAVAWLPGDPNLTPDPSNSGSFNSRINKADDIAEISTEGRWDWVPLSGSGDGLIIKVSIPTLSTPFTATDVRLIGWNGSSWVVLGVSGATGIVEGSILEGRMIVGIQAIGIGLVTNVLAQIGNEGDSPNTVPSIVTVAQINTISPAIVGAIVDNEVAYQKYIDANPGLFATPATAAEVQAMVNVVNASQAVLAQIGNEGDSPNTVPSIVTVAQINTISPAIVGAIVANEVAYQKYIDANPGLFATPATAAEVQAMINAVNTSVVIVPSFTVTQDAKGILSISGTAEKNSFVLITFPDGSSAFVATSVTGAFGPVRSVYPQISKGVVTARAITQIGVSSETVLVYYDYPPTIIIVAPVFTVVQNSNGLLTVSGTAEKNSSVLITFPDGSTTTVIASATGEFGPIQSDTPQANKAFVTAIATVVSTGLSSNLVAVYYNYPITVLVSEAFTPDGDGINDTWVIYELDKYPNSTVRVYNRWGHEVFFSKDYQNDWDGHFKNNSSALPQSGSYYYQIDYSSNGSIDKQGWLYIRK
jgi:gliding motility-associated-like protein